MLSTQPRPRPSLLSLTQEGTHFLCPAACSPLRMGL